MRTPAATEANQKIEAPQGFLFAAAEAGLRTHGSGPDVALICSTAPAAAAALFTTNKVKAAPILISQKQLRRSGSAARAIVVNAGNANCATGEQGLEAARECARTAASLLAIPKEQVLLASTGVIGVPLDFRRITDALPALARQLHPQSFEAVSRAILTTDTGPKVTSRRISVSGRAATILGIAKGAGMIYPRLATMLAFLLTDAAVSPEFLKSALQSACRASFNRISVDGDTSTNDTVFLLANGLAGNRALKQTGLGGRRFLEALTEVTQELAIAMVRGGEGARRLAEIRVEGAPSDRTAEAVARSIALSSLVKTALAGADPNWGRVLAAAGNAGVPLDPSRVDIYLNEILVCKRGGAAEFDESEAGRQLGGREVLIRVVLGKGKAADRFWTCDFTEEYVRINASYRT